MKKKNYPEETGKISVLGHTMRWTLRRSAGTSIFGIRGSRIFELKLYDGDRLAGEYDRGWIKKPYEEDEAANCCVNFLIDRYGQEKQVKKKERMGHAE